jgi:methyl-accepting chemotaxis protein
MDQVTQQNAALVEEASAAAQSMSEHAGQLVEAVSVFKLSAGVQAKPVIAQKGAGLPRALPSPVALTASKSVSTATGKRPAPAARQPLKELATADTGDWKEF